MDLGSSAENAAAVIGLIVGISLALGKAFGATIMHLVEAIKATKLIREGYSGLITIAIGVLFGMALGVLVDAIAEDTFPVSVWLLLGAFAGLNMSADAMTNYKAAGDINVKQTAPTTIVQNAPDQTTGVVVQEGAEHAVQVGQATPVHVREPSAHRAPLGQRR